MICSADSNPLAVSSCVPGAIHIDHPPTQRHNDATGRIQSQEGRRSGFERRYPVPMLQARTNISDAPLTVTASVSGVSLYLDNFALVKLAKADRVLRDRSIAVINDGVDLLFSITNAAESIGPQGRSADLLREFLDALGPHWFPVELNPHEVATRETTGITGGDACLATDFMKQYFSVRTRDCTPGSGKIIDLSHDFFRLSAVLDWLQPQRTSILDGGQALDRALIEKINGYRLEYERDPQWLDQHFPQLPWNPKLPTTFTYVNVIRGLILEAKGYPLKKGDGMDFCHAIIGATFASFATLDKQWKRRVEALPQPHRLAHIYYEPELEDLVTNLERAVATIKGRETPSSP